MHAQGTVPDAVNAVTHVQLQLSGLVIGIWNIAPKQYSCHRLIFVLRAVLGFESSQTLTQSAEP